MLDIMMRSENLIKTFEEEIQRASLFKIIYGNWIRENPTDPYRILVEQFVQEQQSIINGLTTVIKNLKDHGYK